MASAGEAKRTGGAASTGVCSSGAPADGDVRQHYEPVVTTTTYLSRTTGQKAPSATTGANHHRQWRPSAQPSTSLRAWQTERLDSPRANRPGRRCRSNPGTSSAPRSSYGACMQRDVGSRQSEADCATTLDDEPIPSSSPLQYTLSTVCAIVCAMLLGATCMLPTCMPSHTRGALHTAAHRRLLTLSAMLLVADPASATPVVFEGGDKVQYERWEAALLTALSVTAVTLATSNLWNSLGASSCELYNTITQWCGAERKDAILQACPNGDGSAALRWMRLRYGQVRRAATARLIGENVPLSDRIALNRRLLGASADIGTNHCKESDARWFHVVVAIT
jgi:hypothetical protein